MPETDAPVAAPTPSVLELSVDGRTLLLPDADGVADLDRMVALNASAAELWRAHRGGADRQSLARDLAAAARLDADDAAAQVEAFLAGLRPLASGGTAPPAADAPRLDAAGFLRAVRAVLAAGRPLRFRAHGLSMRPTLAHGTVIEATPRPFAAARLGDIALYAVDDRRLVAHRVVGRRRDGLLARGDSAARLDLVQARDFLGVVTARLDRGVRTPLDTPGRRLAGRVRGVLWRVGSLALRATVVVPLRRMPPLRRAVAAVLRGVSSGLALTERVAGRRRRAVDVAIAACTSTAEKDARRRRLYAERSVREFTALDENVEAGLTLIEEVLLHRHPLPPAARVLVLGCGPGREAVALAARGHRVTGLDRDADMLVRARALAARVGVELDLVEGDARDFAAGDAPFDRVVVFSGLCNMVLPSARRVDLLRGARACLAPDGAVLLTFLSDYVRPGAPPPPAAAGLGTAIQPDHEAGDRWLLNEAVHVYPHPDRLVAEAHRAGLAVADLFRDQRAYDRAARQVRGYAVLVPEP